MKVKPYLKKKQEKKTFFPLSFSALLFPNALANRTSFEYLAQATKWALSVGGKVWKYHHHEKWLVIQ